MKSKCYIVNRFAREIGSDDLSDVTNDDIDDWRLGMLQDGVSQRTLNCRMAHVMALYKYLEDMRVPTKVNTRIIHMAKYESKEPLFYSNEEIKNVLRYCKDQREFMLISIAYEAGLRLSELAHIRVEDINDRNIHIVGKGRKPRPTFISRALVFSLEVYMMEYEITEGYIFPGRLNRFSLPTPECALSVDHARNLMRAVFTRAGMAGFHPHALRHSFATTMLLNGADVVVVQKLMGHTNTSTTSRYMHLVSTELQDAHEKFMRMSYISS
jgi:site-specific recombinase XerD